MGNGVDIPMIGIDDVQTSDSKVWSSQKVQQQIQAIPKGEKGEKGDPGTASAAIDDGVTNSTQTWSGQKINEKLSAINPESTTFIKIDRSTNLLNYDTATRGGYYAWNTGKWVAREDIATTDFIECFPKDMFVVGDEVGISGGNVTYWNVNKEYLSGLDATGGKVIVIPDNPAIKYFRISFYTWQLNRIPKQYKINRGTTLLPYEDYKKPSYALDEKIITKTSYQGMPAEVKEAVERVNNSYLDQVTFMNQYGEVSIQEGRDNKYGTSYWLMRINRETFDGKIILPKVKLTGTGINDSVITNVKEYNDKNNYICEINEGIFDVTTNLSDGIIIMDGNVLQDRQPVTSPNQYTLAINGDGVMKSYPHTVNAQTVLTEGARHAVVGFVPIIQDKTIVSDSILNLCPHANTDNPRQIVGQLANNDYIVCSFDGRSTGEAGLTLKECAEILLNYEVKFAYNLDGGGSTQTFVNKKRINRLMEGRKVSNVIVFEKQV